MENFSRHTTAAIAIVFLLATLGWGLAMEKIGQAPVVHCDCHLPTITCVPGSRA